MTILRFAIYSLGAVLRGTPRYYAWLAFLGLVIGLGVVGYSQQVIHGHIVANLRDPVPWGLFIGTYAFFVGVAAAAVVIGATISSERPMLTGAAIAVYSMLACVLVWAAVAVISSIIRRTPADRAYRACVGKTFAVCSMFAAVVVLLAALATMPLAGRYQNKYYKVTRAEQRDEVRAVLGDDWPKSFSGLSPGLFSVDGSPADEF